MKFAQKIKDSEKKSPKKDKGKIVIIKEFCDYEDLENGNYNKYLRRIFENAGTL